MFTGLIETVGQVREFQKTEQGGRLLVTSSLPAAELVLGESIAVNGACLTVVAIGDGQFSADVSDETLQRTTLGRLRGGDKVNLERALRLSDRLGGHLVSGHVDGLARICERVNRGNAVHFRFALPKPLIRLLVDKGSVAVDGISLTVNALSEDGFSVAIIPHTLAHTTLLERQPGQEVNIETDLIGKYVARLLGPAATVGGSAIDADFLAKHGFV